MPRPSRPCGAVYSSATSRECEVGNLSNCHHLQDADLLGLRLRRQEPGGVLSFTVSQDRALVALVSANPKLELVA